MNNDTTARAPLRVSENVSVLEQQIAGLIKREGAGQFYNVEPTDPVVQPEVVQETPKKKTRKK